MIHIIKIKDGITNIYKVVSSRDAKHLSQNTVNANISYSNNIALFRSSSGFTQYAVPNKTPWPRTSLVCGCAQEWTSRQGRKTPGPPDKP